MGSRVHGLLEKKVHGEVAWEVGGLRSEIGPVALQDMTSNDDDEDDHGPERSQEFPRKEQRDYKFWKEQRRMDPLHPFFTQSSLLQHDETSFPVEKERERETHVRG